MISGPGEHIMTVWIRWTLYHLHSWTHSCVYKRGLDWNISPQLIILTSQPPQLTGCQLMKYLNNLSCKSWILVASSYQSVTNHYKYLFHSPKRYLNILHFLNLECWSPARTRKTWRTGAGLRLDLLSSSLLDTMGSVSYNWSDWESCHLINLDFFVMKSEMRKVKTRFWIRGIFSISRRHRSSLPRWYLSDVNTFHVWLIFFSVDITYLNRNPSQMSTPISSLCLVILSKTDL